MSTQQAKYVASTYDKVLSEIVLNSKVRVANLQYCSEMNKHQLWAWNGNPMENVQKCVHDVIEEQTVRRPNAEAVCAWDGSFTYAELSELASRLAQHLVDLGVGPEVFVPLCFDKSKWTIVAILGVLKAGGAFVPLDPSHPVARLQALVHKVEADVILCSPQRVEMLVSIASRIIPVDGPAVDRLHRRLDMRVTRASAHNRAYMIFTSGTTGEPKGALIEHGAILSSAKAHGPAMMMNSETRALQFAASTFDVSITEIITTLTLGGCVCVPSEEARLNNITEAMEAMRVNWALLTPTFVKFIDPADVPSFKTLVTGGEAMTQAIIRTWSHINLINCYGPAETSVVSHVHRGMTEGKNPLNIGRQVGIRCWVVDRYNHNRLMPVGSVGELLIEGSTLAREYYKEEEKTNEAFIFDPLWSQDDSSGKKRRMYKTGDLVRYNSDGTFHIAGRKDTQIKFHGQRIELGEIEHHLNLHRNIKHGLVLLPKAGHCQGRLLTVLQLCNEQNQDLVPKGRTLEFIEGPLKAVADSHVDGAKEFLAGRLPAYMVPSMWLVLEFIPRLQSGKLDRKRVAKWVEDMSESLYRRLNPVVELNLDFLSAATETEKDIRLIWAHVLNLHLDQINLATSFLSLGGDSISAMQVMGKCRKKGIGLTVHDVLRSKSIAHLALLAKEIRSASHHQEILDQPFDLSPIQRLYFSRPNHAKGHYNQSFLLRTSRTVRENDLRGAVEAVIRRHSMLRARFAQTGAGKAWQQRVTNEVASSYRLRSYRVSMRDDVDYKLADTQACLNETSGPMLGADLIDVNGQDQLMFLTGHHLVIDLVSWRIILQDIEELLLDPKALATSDKPLPFQTWSRLEAEHCQGLALHQVLPVEDVPAGNAAYWGMIDRPHIYGELAQEGFAFDGGLTSLLLTRCHQALRTEIPDILISALIHSFAQTFTDRAVPPVFAEGHGREMWDTSIDPSGTVGWFTTMYPVYVQTKPSDDLINTIRFVKDLRRRVPDKGRTYWAKRWLTSEGRETFGKQWPMEITFNYLGQYQQLEREGALLTPASEIAGEVRAAGGAADMGHDTPCISFFEISAVILKGALRFSFTFNRHMKHQATIRRWIATCQETLRMAIESLVKTNPEPTLSDFPLLALTYDRLDLMKSERLPQAGIPSIDLVEDVYPCSSMQQGLLVSTIKDSAFYAAYTVHQVKSKRGESIDGQRLANAWQMVVNRHAMLRTTFIESVSQQDALYDQIVLKRVDANLLRIQRATDADAVTALNEQQQSWSDGDKQLFHRFTICTSLDGNVFCRLEISHVIMDGTSLSIIFRDLALAYEGKLSNGPGPLYSEYIAYLLRQPLQPGIEYWKKYLADVEPCHFPILNDGDSTTKQLKYVRVNFKELTELQRFCDTAGVTFANAIHTAWALTLRCYTDSEEVCFGYITSARDTLIEGSQDAVGPFINMLVCRANMPETVSISQVMSQVQQDYLDCLPYRHTPLAEVQHALRLSTSILFNTALSYRKLPPTSIDEPLITFDECAPTYDPDEYNVSINIEAGEKVMAIDLAYWTDCLSDQQAANVASTFTQSLSNILHHSGQSFGELDNLSELNKEQIFGWNRQMPEVVDECIHNIIKQQTMQRPEAPAICSWDAQYTYQELEVAATRLAHSLVGLGVQPESFVLTCFEKSAYTIIAMLAVLKAGGACVPLDPKHPKAALKLRAADTKSQIVLVAPHLAKIFQEFVPHVVVVDGPFLARLPVAGSAACTAVGPNNACFVIYTSGSTGNPKGVVLQHSGITTSAKAHGPLLGYQQDSRVLQFASYTFDNSLAEIFTTLMRGGCVCVPSEHDRLNNLADAVNKLQANFMDITPTVATFLEPSEVPSLRRLALGGEAVTKRVVEIWGDAVPLCACYGPSECSINAAYSGEIAKVGKATNIGRAVGGVLWVVDQNNHDRLVPVGCIGELLVEGPIVSRGYLNDLEKTARAFIKDPIWAIGSNRRMYKTGDLVRYDSDGTLMYFGRKDTQVKLNGQRIELGEIEHHVEHNLPTDAQSAVELVNLGGSKKALAAFVCLQSDGSVPDASEDHMVLPMSDGFRATAKALEIALTAAIPAYMVPTVWLPVARMPLTSSGKLNRRRLRTVAQSIPNEQAATYRLAAKSGRAPSTEMEKRIAGIWESILNLESGAIGAEDSFFKLGGDSIGAMRLVTVARSLDILLTVATIFQKPKLSLMAGAATSGIASVVPVDSVPFSMIKDVRSVSQFLEEIAAQCQISVSSIQDVYPCTSIQEGLMALSIKEPGAYVAQMMYRLPSEVDVNKFRTAWERVVESEMALRTRIAYTKDRGFLQIVVQEPIAWHTISNLAGLKENERQLPAYDGGALTRYTIVGKGTKSPYFVWTIHHALYDGWSLPLILAKVKACYDSTESAKLAASPLYPTFIRHLTEIDTKESDAFWHKRLSEATSLQFPRLPHPAYQARASGLITHTAQVTRQAGSEITPASTVRAAWALVVAAYSGSDDVVFCETVTGRDAPVTGIADMIGPTLATVPTRLAIDRGHSIAQFLETVQAQSAEAMPYQYAGMQNIKRLSPDAAIACESQNLIAINNGSRDSTDLFWDMQNNEMAGTNFYTYPLMLSINVSDEKVEVDAHYDEEILPTWQVERLLHNFEFIMARLCSRKGDLEALGEMDILSPRDQETIISWNSDPYQVVDKCIHHVIQEQALTVQDKTPAVCSWDASFTYRELDDLTTRLAFHLVTVGICCETIVPLCFEKSAWTIVAMLAVLKAGGAFVPLNPTDPEARLRDIVGDVKASVVLCSPKYKSLCDIIASKAISIDGHSIGLFSSHTGALPNVPTNSAAYIIFTSGTTGKPKGTLIEHAAFSTSGIAHGTIMQMQSARVLQFASYTFDASVMEILTTLMLGGCVCVPSDETRLNNVASVINELDVNWTLLTPSFVQLLSPSEVPRLQTLVLGGEAMSQGHISTWAQSVRLMNAYGPSECAIVATVNPSVSLKAGPTNMGRAVGGRCWIVDLRNHHRLVPIGSVGELLVEGPILARGYLNNSQKTAESFVIKPKWAKHYGLTDTKSRRMYKTGDLVKYAADGTMTYLGRKDTQVKLHGQRLELGEVEHHLSTDPVIQHALAAIPSSGSCRKRLVAVLSLHALANPKPASEGLQIVRQDVATSYLSAIRERIGSHLPTYMVPSRWVVLQELPLMPSGKLDRRKVIAWVENMSDETYRQISDVEAAANNIDREATAIESQLQSIWGHVLNIPVDTVAFNQSFLHLGGDSMSALQVMARCRAENIGVSVQAIMQSKSIPQLALTVTVPEEISYSAEETEKSFDLSPIQQLYFECVGDDWVQFDQSVFLKLKRKTGVAELTHAMDAIAKSHSMLRARYTKTEAGAWQQRITQDTPQSHRVRLHRTTTFEHISRLIEKSQKDLNIVEGPLIVVDVFDPGNDEGQMLSIVAHHLVIDIVSWRIVLQDLEDYLGSGSLKAQSSLPFQTWCRLQAEQATKEAAKKVLPNDDVPIADLGYWGMADEVNVHGDVVSETFEMDAKTTLLLLGTAHEALQTEPVDVFMASILESFRRIFPDRMSAPAIYNEGHGREPWDPRIDLSQTVGWFTTISPVFLPSMPIGDDELIDIIRWVKDLRRRIPEKGRQYFASRFLTAEGKERFSAHWPMEIMFNYLGQTQKVYRKDALLQPVDVPLLESISTKSDIGSNVPRFSLFEISASVTSGSVKFTFSYNRQMKRQASIRLWVIECQRVLQEAVERLAQMRPEPTMSDFPLLPLSYDGLSKLRNKLPQMGITSIKDLEDAYPCSPVQQGILFTQVRDAGYYAYRSNFEVKTTDLSRPVDIKRLAAAWQVIVQRHSTLRTVFVESIFQEAMMDQVVIKNWTARVKWLECEDSDVLNVLERQPSIDCTDGLPPHQLTVCKTYTGRVFCILEMSHAICDGTSMPILYRDLAQAYEGKLPRSDIAPVYSEYISHMQYASTESDIDYWKSYLRAIEPCYFPSLNDGLKKDRQLKALRQDLTLGPELQSFCTRNGLTPSNVLQLVWALVLRSYTGLEDVCFGYLIAGRDLPVRGIQDAIGVFINMLTCRMNLGDGLQIGQALKQVQNDFIDGMTHQHVSLADVQHELELSGTSLFNTAYSFQKRSMSKDMTNGPLSFNVLEANDPSEYDITVNVEVWDSNTEVEFCYWTDKLSEAQASNVASTFDQILSTIIRQHDSGQTLGEIDLLSEHCLRHLVSWNAQLPEKVDRCVHEIFEQHARTPTLSSAPAIHGWDGNFTYNELNETASRLAARLTQLGVAPESYVPLCFDKSSWAIVAMLGVMKAGGAFVPLDPAHPESRHKFLIDNVKAKVVLCSPQHEKKFAATTAKPFIISGKTINQLPKKSNKPASVTPDNAAYIIFTSGTTGLPKGTIIEHAAYSTGGLAHAKAMNMFPGSRVLQFASYTFDASIMEILSCLMIGGCVCVPSDQERMNDIPGSIKRLGVTWTLLTPSVASILKPENVPSLKVLVTGGEAMSEGHITKWAGRMSLVNAYGPSECSVVATTSIKVDNCGNTLNAEPSNIGHAVGSRSWVVDPRNHNRLMPVGSIGELVVEGRIVARGYLNNEQKTKDAFISNPAWSHDERLQTVWDRRERMYKTGDLVKYNSDGSLTYLGRKDTQIKLNGQRIELGEIEHHVKVSLPEEMQSAVDLVAPEGRVATKALAVFFCSQVDEPHESTPNPTGQSAVDEYLLPMSNTAKSTTKSLEAALKRALPAYMVPTLYVPITKMPWTTSGKLDRTRLRNMVQKLAPEDVVLYKLAGAASKRAPATEMEARLQNAWEAVLHLAKGTVGADDNFFRVGGDSITAMRLAAAARAERVSLTVLNVLRFPKLADMATTCVFIEDESQTETKAFALLDDSSSTDTLLIELAEKCGVSKSLVEDAYPCSSLQEGLITLSIKQAGAYVSRNIFEVPSGVDIAKFKTAWQKTIEQLEILRTRIVHTKSLKFVQLVLEAQPTVWHVSSNLKAAICEEVSLPEFNGGPLARYTLIHDEGSGKTYFLWSMHHALYDGWSMPMMLQRVECNYFEGNSTVPKSPYVSFIKYLLETNVQTSDEFWKSRFLGASPAHFPSTLSNNSHAAANNQVQTHSTHISRNSIATDITVPTVIRAAWATVVAAYTGSDDVIFGETLSGRDVPVPGITDITGPTLTTVPTRIQVDRKLAVTRFLKEVHQQATNVIPYQHAGLHHIKRLNNDTSAACEFQNLLVIQTSEEKQQDRLLRWYNTGVETNFFTYPLVLECSIGEGKIETTAHFDGNILTKWQVQRLLYQFDSVVKQLGTGSKTKTMKISQLEICSPEDIKSIREWNRYKLGFIDSCIHDLFLQQAVSQPEATAICAWDGDLTYREVKEHAIQVANHLMKLGVGPEMLVPMCLNKSSWSVITMLGVLLAGGAFVPLDPAHPVSRHAELILDTKAKVVICSPEHKNRYTDLVPTVVSVDKETIQHLATLDSSTRFSLRGSSQNAAFVIYTSGSTGRPKGVLIEHRAFCTSSAAFRRAMYMKPTSRVLNFASYTFDAGVMEVLSTLTCGACVCVPDEHTRLNNVSGAISSMNVTWTFLTPSIANIIDPKSVPCLEVLACGGEALSAETVNTWADNVKLVNGYGPAECSVFAVVNGNVSEEKDSSRIGRAPSNNHTWIVDPDNHDMLSPVGCVGELLLEGPILARGYVNNEQKTSEVFIESPAWMKTFNDGKKVRLYKTGDLARYCQDGALVYIGRKDKQVKLHGQRIELGEIEHALETDSRVRHAVVALPKLGLCKHRLSVVVELAELTFGPLAIAASKVETTGTAQNGKEKEQLDAIQQRLSEQLPPFMIPTVWLSMKAIPLLVSGKLDKKKMETWMENIDEETYGQAMGIDEEEEIAAPKTATEELLRQIWSRVLNVPLEKVGANQSFLALGGDSITAMQVMSRCREEKISLSLQAVLKSKSLAQLSETIDFEKRSIRAVAIEHVEKVDEWFDLSPIQSLYFDNSFDQECGDRFNQSFFLKLTKRIKPEDLQRAINSIVEQHSMLRARFSKDTAGRWKQCISPNTPSSYRYNSHRVDRLKDTAPIVGHSQKSLNIQTGPQFVVDLFDVKGDSQAVSLIAHHLVIDMVSWLSIMQDLETILTTGNLGVAKPLSFQSWCLAQVENATYSDPILPFNFVPADLNYWGIEHRANRYGDVIMETLVTEKALTAPILNDCHKALRTEPVDLFLATIAHSFSRVFFDRKLPTLFNEGHGREPWDNSIDLSRTVGWFTTVCPVQALIDLEEDDVLDTLRQVKDARRRISDNGRPYFAHRYLTEKGKSQFSDHMPMEITFNYLGRMKQVGRDESLLESVDYEKTEEEAKMTSDVGPDTSRLALFEISAAVTEDGIQFSFMYNRHMKRQSKIRRWIAELPQVLEEYVQRLVAKDPEPTLSDLPLLPISYDGLRKLINTILPAANISDFSEVHDIYPCSPMQEGMLLSQLKNPASYLFHTILEVQPAANSSICGQDLVKAWQKVVDRHAALRTVFIDGVHPGAAFDQIVLRKVVSPATLIQCKEALVVSKLNAISLEKRLREKGLQLPHQLTVAETPKGKLFIKLEMSHAITDGASTSLVINDLVRSYEGRLPSDEAPGYSEYIRYLVKQPPNLDLDYWKTYLKNVKPCQFPSLSKDSANRRLSSVEIDFGRFAELQLLCKEYQVTLSNLMLATWALILRSYTKSDDVCFGYLTSGRDAPIDGVGDTMGVFINMLVYRFVFTPTLPLPELFQKAQDDYISSLPHQHCSLAKVQHALNVPRTGLFNTAVSIQNSATSDVSDQTASMTFEPVVAHDPSEVSTKALPFRKQANAVQQYSLTLNINTAQNDEGVLLRYWSDMLTDDQANKLASTLATLFGNIIDRPRQTISQLDLFKATTENPAHEQLITLQPSMLKDLVRECAQEIVAQLLKEGTLVRHNDAPKTEVKSQPRVEVEEVEELQPLKPMPTVEATQPTFVERTLLSLWADCLSLDEDEIGNDDSFFQLGGDSIIAMTMVGAARDQGLSMTVADVFRNPMFGDMAKAVRATKEPKEPKTHGEVKEQKQPPLTVKEDIPVKDIKAINPPPTYKEAQVVKEQQLVKPSYDLIENQIIKAPRFIREPSYVKEIHTIKDGRAAKESETQIIVREANYSDSDSGRSGRTGTDDSYEHFSLLDVSNIDIFLQEYVCPHVHVFRGGIVDVLPVTDFQALAIAGTLLETRWMLNYFYLEGSGPLDLRRLKRSAFQLVQAFDILRTVFIPWGDQYLQVVLRQLQPDVLLYETDQDLAEWTATFYKNQQDQCPRLGESYVQFAVAKQKKTENHRIFIRLSHAQYDGVCFPAILDALRAGYLGESVQTTPPFANFVSKTAGRITRDSYTHWQTLLKGSSMTNVVHRERPKFTRSKETTSVLRKTIALKSLSSVNITPATIIKAAWSLVLGQVSSRSDIVFGHVISGRNTAVREVENIVGSCVNIVPVRVKFQPNWTVLDLLQSIQDQQVTNMPFESLGFREIIKQCTDWPDWTNFSTVVQHQSMAQHNEVYIGDNTYKVGAVASQEDFADFTIVSTPKDADHVEVCLIYAPNSSITGAFAEQVFNGLCHTITNFSMNPNSPLPSPMDFISMQRPSFQRIVSSTSVPSLAHVLRGLSKKELYVLSDSLCRAWRQILRDKQGNFVSIPPDSSFFNLGGDIIGLAQVAALLEREGYKVRLEDLIDNPVLSDQMALLSLQSSKASEAEQNQMQSLNESLAQPSDKVTSEKRGSIWRRMMGRGPPKIAA